MEVNYRKALISDIPYLGNNMRQCDKDEVYASCGMYPHDALKESMELSDKTWVATVGISPIAIFGISVINEEFSVVWMLGTDELYDHPREIMRASKRIIKSMHEHSRILYNYVDTRNVKAIQWLLSIGFKISYVEEAYGHLKLPFVCMTHEAT